jgi:hypothetical protein
MLNASKLIGEIVGNCVINNIGCKFIPLPYVMSDGIKCSGYFDEKEIIVAAKKSDWLDVFVHESCHLDQFLEKTPVYKVSDRSLNIIEGWLTGKKYSKTKLINAFRNNILLELDCEQRTVEKLKKFRINMDYKLYRRQANAYLFSYWATYKNRKWFDFPYNNQNIVSQMPSKFLSEEEYLNENTEYLKYFK